VLGVRQKLEKPMWNRVLIVILSLVCAGGGFIAGRQTAGNLPLAASEDFLITLSDQSKPEEGLYVISFHSHANYMYYFSTSYGFVLDDDARGFQESYRSAPHGQFIGYDLPPHTTVDLQAKLVAGENSLEYEQGGQVLYPSSSDTIRLSGSVIVWELHAGTCRELSFDFPLKATPLQDFMDDEDLRSKKDASLNESGSLDKLPPIDY